MGHELNSPGDVGKGSQHKEGARERRGSRGSPAESEAEVDRGKHQAAKKHDADKAAENEKRSKPEAIEEVDRLMGKIKNLDEKAGVKEGASATAPAPAPAEVAENGATESKPSVD